MRDLSSQTRDWTLTALQVEAESHNHWTTREVPHACSCIPQWRQIISLVGNRREKLEYLPLFGIFTSFLPLSNPCCFLKQSLAMALLLGIWRQYFLEGHLALVKIIPFNFINPLIGPNNFVSQFALSKCWQIRLIQSCLKIFKLYFILTPCSLSWLLGFIENLDTTRNKTNPTQIFSNLSYLDRHYIICFQTLLNQRINLLKKKKTECQVEFNLNQTNKDLLNTSHVPFTVSEGGNYKNEWDVSLAFYKDESGGGDKTCTETTLTQAFWKLEFTLIIVPGTWNDIVDLHSFLTLLWALYKLKICPNFSCTFQDQIQGLSHNLYSRSMCFTGSNRLKLETDDNLEKKKLATYERSPF